MNYINEDTLEYPVSVQTIISRHNDMVFSTPFTPFPPYMPVALGDIPMHDALTHKVEEVDPVKLEFGWVRQYHVVPLSAEDASAAQAQAQAELLQAVQTEAQVMLDNFARTRRYDGIVSLASYATSKDPVHAAEGQLGVDLRDAVWGSLKALEADVLAGTRPMPTYDEALAELPPLVWAD